MGNEVHYSSGNVFADLGLPNPEECLAKAHIIVRIKEIVREEGLTQEAAAKRMGIPRSHLSNLLRGSFGGFSLDRLLRCLKALGQDVELRIRPTTPGEGAGHLTTVLESAAAGAGEEAGRAQAA